MPFLLNTRDVCKDVVANFVGDGSINLVDAGLVHSVRFDYGVLDDG